VAAHFDGEWLSFGFAPFTELIGFDLGSAAAHRTGGWYGRGLTVLVPAKPPGTDFWPLVDFVALVMRFSSVIADPFTIMI
jgi:hypothetical protein